MSEEALDIPYSRCAIIRLCGRSNHFLDTADIRQISFDVSDVEDADVPGSMTPAHARSIRHFLESLPDEVTDLYVCCSKGGSRSAGCAAALLLISGRSDTAVWENPYYTPNTLVFYRICNEFGLEITWEDVLARVAINEKSFADAQAKRESSRERWEILF